MGEVVHPVEQVQVKLDPIHLGVGMVAIKLSDGSVVGHSKVSFFFVIATLEAACLSVGCHPCLSLPSLHKDDLPRWRIDTDGVEPVWPDTLTSSSLAGDRGALAMPGPYPLAWHGLISSLVFRNPAGGPIAAISAEFNPIPEPSTLSVLVLGGLWVCRRRRAGS